MSLCQNPVNGWEINTLRVNGGDVIPTSLNIETIVAFRCSLVNLYSYFYPIFNESTEIVSPQIIRGITVLITPEEDVSILIKDRSDAGECRVDVNIFTDVGLIWDNYVKTTFYPFYAKGDLSCAVVVRRPITPETITNTSSMVSEGVLKQWAYYINNTSDASFCGTVGVVAEVVMDNEISMRAMGSLITDNNATQIFNTSDMDGGQGLIFVNGYLKLDLDSNECCVYPEAQTEEDINCNGN